MTINFEYQDVSASPRLEEMATERIKKLENKYDFMVATDVYFRKENTSSDKTGMICGIRVNIPGSTVFSESNTASFEAALAQTANEVGSQLQRKKEKMQSHN